MMSAVNYIIEHRCEICEKIRESFFMLAPIAIPFLIMWMASH